MTSNFAEQPSSDCLLVKEAVKNFAGLKAVNDVTMRLDRGEILGLIGPNGSGKTTLINLITGLLPLSSGQILISGNDLTSKPAYMFARSGVARTFQTIRLFRELTVFENVEVAAVGVGISRKEAKERASAELEELGIANLKDKRANELSYGYERRVEVARALAMNPKFLMVDEPAAGLNEDESDELLEILAPIPQKKNLGMLIVDHDMRLIMRLCHRLHVLNYGKTIGEGSPNEVRKIPAVIEAYLGKSTVGV